MRADNVSNLNCANTDSNLTSNGNTYLSQRGHHNNRMYENKNNIMDRDSRNNIYNRMHSNTNNGMDSDININNNRMDRDRINDTIYDENIHLNECNNHINTKEQYNQCNQTNRNNYQLNMRHNKSRTDMHRNIDNEIQSNKYDQYKTVHRKSIDINEYQFI
eukprot:446717_1